MKKTIRIILFILAVVCLVGVIASISDKSVFGIIFYFVFAAIFGAGWYLMKRKAKGSAAPSATFNKAPVAQTVNGVSKMKCYPEYVGTARLTYNYNCVPDPIEGHTIKEILGDQEKVVDMSADEEKVILSYEGVDFATVSNPHWARMIRDFNKKGYPVNAVLLADERANLRFYVDKRVHGANRQKSVVKLVSYRSEDCQESISYISEDRELDYEEETGEVLSDYNAIGKLPAKYKNQIEDENYYAMFLHHIENEETEDGNEYAVPYIKIYW